MTLVLGNSLDLFAIASTAFVVRAMAADGETTWFEGLLLIGVYVLFGSPLFPAARLLKQGASDAAAGRCRPAAVEGSPASGRCGPLQATSPASDRPASRAVPDRDAFDELRRVGAQERRRL